MRLSGEDFVAIFAGLTNEVRRSRANLVESLVVSPLTAPLRLARCMFSTFAIMHFLYALHSGRQVPVAEGSENQPGQPT